MQFMFVYVLLGPYFLGGDFELEIAAARTSAKDIGFWV